MAQKNVFKVDDVVRFLDTKNCGIVTGILDTGDIYSNTEHQHLYRVRFESHGVTREVVCSSTILLMVSAA